MDLSHQACPDHPCDRCDICRSGICCARACAPSAPADRTAAVAAIRQLLDTATVSRSDAQFAGLPATPASGHLGSGRRTRLPTAVEHREPSPEDVMLARITEALKPAARGAHT